MLSRIFIQNFALIDQLEIQLKNGLQVITGETGAGKSIILGALRLILGERADLKAISDAEVKSIVEAEFTISEQLKSFFEKNDLDFDTASIIRREILPSGKSRAFINDAPVTLDILKKLSEKLIDIHSQFETSNLFNEDYQFKIIDGLSENKNLLASFQYDFSEYKKFGQKLSQLKSQLANSNKEADYKNFLLNELQELHLDEIDYENLQHLLSTQENAEYISEQLSQVLGRFQMEDVGVLSSLNEIKNKISKIAELSPAFVKISQRLEENFVELKDISNEIEREVENIEIKPELLASLHLTNNKINDLLLKHKAQNIDDLKTIRDKLSDEQDNFSYLEQQISETEEQISKLEANLIHQSKILTENRQKAIPIFCKNIEVLLKQLGLEKAKIEVDLQKSNQLNLFGNDQISILFQANSGFPMKPIQTAISGGERSRVMLAVKKIMADNAELPTLILDEIDTGVSGKVAEEIGNVMREMSKNMQLIVISHLAQVAAKGDNNYKVIKQEIDGKTQSTIIPLNETEKLNEIAQLLSGSKITDAALQQAKELMR